MIRVPPSGPLNACLVILGESPGAKEEVEGRPFCGASGKVLELGLGRVDREKTYITNVRKHRPPENQNKRARMEEIASEYDDLCDEFAALSEARCVLLVGADALRSVLGTEQISRWHGSFLTRAEAVALRELQPEMALVPLPPKVHTIAVTLHPAFALRGNLQFKIEIAQVMARAQRWAHREVGPVRPHRDLFDLEFDLEACEYALEKADTICIDVETPREGKGIDVIGFGVHDGRVWSGAWAPSTTGEIMQRLLRRPCVLVGHNLLFDLGRFLDEGLEITDKPIIADTMVGGAALWPPISQQKKKQGGPSRLSLAACTTRLIDGWWNWKQPDTDETQVIYQVNYPGVRQWQWPRLYNALDVHSNIKMWWPMRELLRREEML